MGWLTEERYKKSDKLLGDIINGMAAVAIFFAMVWIGAGLLIHFAPKIKALSIAIFGG